MIGIFITFIGAILVLFGGLNKQESALKNIDTAMNGFKDTLMGQKTYQNKGKYQQGPDKSGHLVSKEA